MSDDIFECYKCGFVNSGHEDEIAGYVEFECTNCGTLNQVHVSPAVPYSDESQSQKQTVKVVWKEGKPSLEEIKVVREFVPELKNESLSALRKTLSESEFYELGTFVCSQAKLIKSSIESKGLIVNID